MMRLFVKIGMGVLSTYALLVLVTTAWPNIRDAFLLSILSGWLGAWTIAEGLSLLCKRHSHWRLLTHLRHGPIALLLCFFATVLAYDQAMILYSKWEIRQYVYGNESPKLTPRLTLHNNYRGWCGNGYSAVKYALYAETAAEGFESTDPAVRARSLLASIAVYDWLNGGNDGPFPDLIDRASSDPDPVVRRIAFDLHAYDLHSDKHYPGWDNHGIWQPGATQPPH